MSVQVVFSDRESAGQVVSNYAAEHGFDILVLGRRGDGAHLRSRLGRVAGMAAQTCSIPVLLLSAPCAGPADERSGQFSTPSCRCRSFCAAGDMFNGRPVYREILDRARSAGLSGATGRSRSALVSGVLPG